MTTQFAKRFRPEPVSYADYMAKLKHEVLALKFVTGDHIGDDESRSLRDVLFKPNPHKRFSLQDSEQRADAVFKALDEYIPQKVLSLSAPKLKVEVGTDLAKALDFFCVFDLEGSLSGRDIMASIDTRIEKCVRDRDGLAAGRAAA